MESFLSACIIMGATVVYLLILQKYIQIKKYPLCLGNISRDFSVYNIKKEQD